MMGECGGRVDPSRSWLISQMPHAAETKTGEEWKDKGKATNGEKLQKLVPFAEKETMLSWLEEGILTSRCSEMVNMPNVQYSSLMGSVLRWSSTLSHTWVGICQRCIKTVEIQKL